MLVSILRRDAYGARKDVIAILGLLFIAVAFCVMSVIAFVCFEVGFPAVAMSLAAIALTAFVLAFWDGLRLVGSISDINEAMLSDPHEEFDTLSSA